MVYCRVNGRVYSPVYCRVNARVYIPMYDVSVSASRRSGLAASGQYKTSQQLGHYTATHSAGTLQSTVYSLHFIVFSDEHEYSNIQIFE